MQPLAMMCPAARIVNQAQARVFLRKESQSAQQPMVPWSMAWWSHRGVRKIIRVQLQYKPASWSIWETLYDDICNISYAFDLYCFYFALWYNYAIYTLYIYIWVMFTSSHLWFIPVVQRRRTPKVTINLGRAEAFEQKLELLGLLRWWNDVLETGLEISRLCKYWDAFLKVHFGRSW